MNENLHNRNAEQEENEALSSFVSSNQMGSITIVFVSRRHGMQELLVQVLMNKSEKVSRLSYNLAEDIQNTRGEPIGMDLGKVNLNWCVAPTSWSYITRFKLAENMDVDVILGERDSILFEEDRDRSGARGSVLSLFCHTSPTEKERQDEEAAARKSKNDEGMVEALRIMNEKDRKRREKALLKEKSSQGQDSGSQQGSSQNS